MPIIRVEMFPGRTDEQKRDLVDALSDAFVRTAGASKDVVHVLITEIEPRHWAVGGRLSEG